MNKFGFRKLMVFIILSASVAIAYQVPNLRYTFYDQMMTVLGLNNTQMGYITIAVTVANTICYIPSGFLADRFSCRSLVCISFAAFTLLAIWYSFTTNFIVLIVIHAIYGFFGTGVLWSAYLNGIRNLGDKDNQSTLFGSSEATRGLIQALFGFLFLGIMGAATSLAFGFKSMLLVAAAITFVFFLLAVVFLPKEERNELSEDESEDEEHYTWRDVLKNKGVWIVSFLLMGCYTLWTLGNSYLTTYTVNVLNVSDSLASALGIIRSYIIVVLAGFLGGFVVDRFTYKGKALVILLLICIALILTVMFTAQFTLFCAVMTIVLAFVVNIMKSTYWGTMGQAGIPVKMTPIATGIISFICFMPDAVLFPICGAWLDAATAAGDVSVGFTKIFLLMLAFAILGIVFGLILIKRTKKLEKDGLTY